jgi:ABC-type Fe3+/spermidine/putrescine transport system ATPase subunit
VTHDQEDAFAIADRIAVIRKGQLLQVGAPDDLYSRPASLGVAGFIGRSTILPAENVGADRAAIVIGGMRREFAVTRPSGSDASHQMKAVLRPDALDLVAADADGAWPGEVLTRRFAGGFAVYRVKLAGDVVMEIESNRMDVREGDRVGVVISREPVPTVAGDE